VLALFAVTSSPLLLGNDAREGRMQPRLIKLLTNPDLIAVDQYYSADEKFAGGRIWSAPVGKEIWAKPLQPGVAAAVLLNRFGASIGKFEHPEKLHGGIAEVFAPYPGCYVLDGGSITVPCDENATTTSGEQQLTLDFSVLPRSWLGLPARDAPSNATISCDLFDILATPSAGTKLGPSKGEWSATVQPHAVKFLRLENCTES
jgi:hypothetical protein